MPPNQQKKVDGVRIACTLRNASTSINGVAFAGITIGKESIHLSERVEREVAERFATIPGYTIWDGDEAAHARAIEDALAKSQRAAVGTAGAAHSAEADLRRQLTEAHRANHAQTRELRELKDKVAMLTESNTALTKELDALKAAGVKAPESEAPQGQQAAGQQTNTGATA